MKGLESFDQCQRRGWHHNWSAILLLIVVALALPAARLPAKTDDVAQSADPVAAGARSWAAGHMLPEATEDATKTFLPYVKRDVFGPPRNRFGVQPDGPGAVQLMKSAEAGAGWIRISFRWYWFEPTNTTPDQYIWSTQFDEWLKQVADQGIHVIFTLSGNPDWAATYPDGVLDRTNPGELAEFLSAAVSRYSVPPYNVQYWEMYNEPDNGDETWAERGVGYWGNEPEAYAQMLATVYPAMKAANPNVQVMFGGLAYDFWPEDGGPFVKEFLDQVLQHNAGPYFDMMNFHYYVRFDPRWAPYGPGLLGKTNFLRDKLASYGLNKPFACTETGMESIEEHGSSEELQSRFVVQTFSRSLAAHLDITSWFTLVDQEGYWKSGLLYLDLSTKPSFSAYQIMARQLGSVSFVRVLSPEELGAVSVEAYAFFDARTSTQVLTAWSLDGLDHVIQIRAEQVTVIDKYGGESVRRDGDDGQVDNVVHLQVGPSPVYLRFARDGLTSLETPVVP